MINSISEAQFHLKKLMRFLLWGALIFFFQLVQANPASEFTVNENRKMLEALPFHDRQDFEDAMRGFLVKPDQLIIKNKQGKIVWDLESYKSFISIEQEAPDTVNPSLWRNAQLNVQYGLFEVVDGIYQVRGYDLANISFIKGKRGWVVFDVGSSVETAKAAYDLVTEHFGEALPVTAVIYSHSHADHYAGIRGLVDEQDVASGAVQIIAPEDFMEHAISEGIVAGNAMSRRATYMFGVFLPRNPQGSVGAGLGLTNPRGQISLIAPNIEIKTTGETRTVDGIEMVFQMTPGTEAPTEMNIYLPQFKAMWMAENTTNTMHNVLTLRGALVRDASQWARYINETIELYGSAIDVKFQSHHWPVWGNERVLDYLKKQRDLYKFIHDRSVHLMNKGYNGEEIAEMIKLPASLENFWPARGHYGTLRHNARAVYQRYMGWYDGNPSSLNVLPPVEAAKKYVEYMGGEDKVLKHAREDFNKGEYRWVAMVLKHVVFANPDNAKAKELLADAYEQLGYQAEAGPWRSIYLQGAYELRHGVPDIAVSGSVSPNIIRAMEPELLFDYWAVLLDAEKAESEKFSIQIHFTDIKKQYTLTVENAVLNYSRKQISNPDVSITMSKAVLNDVQLGIATWEDKVKSGEIEVAGNKEVWNRFYGMLEKFQFWFNIVTP